MSNDIPIQKRIASVLQNVQILHQSGEIDSATKNQVVQLLQTARKTNDMSELHSIFKRMTYGTLLPDVIDELVRITAIEKT